MDKQLSSLIKELKIEQKKVNNLIVYLAETFSHITNDELKAYNIDKKVLIMARSLIIEIHILLEFYIDECIANYFITQEYFLYPLNKIIFKNTILRTKNLSFKDKIDILRKTHKSQLVGYFKILERINNVRNAFVHGYPINDKKFNYKDGEQIFHKNNIFNLWDDAFKIIDILKKCIGPKDSNGRLTEAIRRRMSIEE